MFIPQIKNIFLFAGNVLTIENILVFARSKAVYFKLWATCMNL